MKQLRKSEIKELNEKLAKYDIELGKKDKVIINDINQTYSIISINDKPEFFEYDNKIIPLLKSNTKYFEKLKKIIVDMGAIRFVASGADIMRPGIVEIEDSIEEDEPVAIIDTDNKKVLSMGIAMFNSENMKSKDSGKVIKNIHYPNDDLWKNS
jgi:PUA-domain protein